MHRKHAADEVRPKKQTKICNRRRSEQTGHPVERASIVRGANFAIFSITVGGMTHKINTSVSMPHKLGTPPKIGPYILQSTNLYRVCKNQSSDILPSYSFQLRQYQRFLEERPPFLFQIVN